MPIYVLEHSEAAGIVREFASSTFDPSQIDQVPDFEDEMKRLCELSNASSFASVTKKDLMPDRSKRLPPIPAKSRALKLRGLVISLKVKMYRITRRFKTSRF